MSAVKIFHEVEKREQRFFLVLLVAVCVDAKDVFALALLDSPKSKPGNRSFMNGDGKYAARSGAQRSELIAAFFFGGDVFEVALLLFEAHVAELQQLFELRPDAFAKVRQRQRLDVHRVGARQAPDRRLDVRDTARA